MNCTIKSTRSANMMCMPSCREIVLSCQTVTFIKNRPLLSQTLIPHTTISLEEAQQLDDNVVVSTESRVDKGSAFMAIGGKIQSVKDAQNIYKKVSVDPYAASTDIRIFVYSFATQRAAIRMIGGMAPDVDSLFTSKLTKCSTLWLL